jgi:hypothetical protein
VLTEISAMLKFGFYILSSSSSMIGRPMDRFGIDRFCAIRSFTESTDFCKDVTSEIFRLFSSSLVLVKNKNKPNGAATTRKIKSQPAMISKNAIGRIKNETWSISYCFLICKISRIFETPFSITLTTVTRNSDFSKYFLKGKVPPPQPK